ncbi:MAG: NUDIX hydrolase [Bacillota bacterium]|nr:NUDIX hydrolase [Bacillota bacterium]
MNKHELIKLIDNYSTDYPEEKEYKEQIISFLNKNDIFLGKSNKQGHITSSAWLVSQDRRKVLLTHHRKLDKWLQLGGHTEEDETVLTSALREAKEESGLLNIKVLSEDIFDIDVHTIPIHKGEKEHFHYDIRFIFEANHEESIVVSSESKDVKWVDIDEISMYSESQSILRMVKKIPANRN